MKSRTRPSLLSRRWQPGNKRHLAAKVKATATALTRKVRQGAVSAADALVKASRDPSALTVRLLNADLAGLSLSEGISVTRPDAATLAVADGQGNGLIINEAADPACVVEMPGNTRRLSDHTLMLIVGTRTLARVIRRRRQTRQPAPPTFSSIRSHRRCTAWRA